MTGSRLDRTRVVLRAGVVATVLAAVAACGQEAATGPAIPASTTTPATTPTGEPAAPPVRVVRLDIVDGAPSGDVGRVRIDLGSTVELIVASDAADEVHLHGYDVTADVEAGGTATVRFVADIPGVFEVELHERRIPLAQLEVS